LRYHQSYLWHQIKNGNAGGHEYVVFDLECKQTGIIDGDNFGQQLELLQGASDQKEWELLENYLSTQYYLEASQNTWPEAARIYFELRRKGVTTNSPVDCCIAQIALEYGSFLLHRDKDFEKIARIRPLEQGRFRLG